MKQKKYISLKNILLTFILCYIVVVLFDSIPLFLDVEDNQLFDEMTFILSLGMGVILLFAVKFSRRELFEQVAVICTIFLLFVLPRFVTYGFGPGLVVWPFGGEMQAGIVNIGVFYVVIGTVLFLGGMVFADISFRPSSGQDFSGVVDKVLPSSKILVMVFFVGIGIQLYSSLVVGISPYGKMRADRYNTVFQLVRALFELDGASLFVFGGLLFRYSRGYKRDKVNLFIVGVCYLVVTVICGSRAGALRVVIFFVISWVVVGDRLRLKFVTFWRSGAAVIVCGLGVFYFGTMSRALITGSYVSDTRYSEYAVSAAEQLRSARNLSMVILNRIGVVDYAVLVVTQEGDADATKKYMNFAYAGKNIINMLVPGTVFPEAQIMTSRVVDVIYRGAPEPQMYRRYFSEHWTLWGLAYVFFGNDGGLLFLFVIGFIMHSLYLHIVKLSSGLVQFYLKLWFLFYVNFNVMINMGIDSAVNTLVFGLITFVNLYICINLMNYFSRRVNRSVVPVVEA